jgi:formyl-CoA transferase
MQEAVVNLTRVAMSSFNDTHKARPRMGNAVGANMPGGGTFKCKPGGPDDYVFIAAMPRRDNLWRALVRAIGGEELVRDERYFDPVWLSAHAAEVNALIEAWTVERTKFEVFHILGKAGVPCGPTLNAEDIFADPHLMARDMIVKVQHPKRGEFLMPGCPIKLSDSPVEMEPAPLLGQHTEEALHEVLGFGAKELAELRQQGLIA